MNTKTIAKVALALAGWLLAAQARAANPAYLNIDVTITANLSVTVNGAQSSTHTVAWSAANPNERLFSAATSTVTNDSGGQTEKWALSTNAYSRASVAGSTWALAASTSSVGDDEFAVQAVFGSSNTAAGSCPIAAASDWNQSYAPGLTTSPVTYTSATFADANLANLGTPNPDVAVGAANGRMKAGSRRALCWRVITPGSTSTADTQNVQVVVTAQNP